MQSQSQSQSQSLAVAWSAWPLGRLVRRWAVAPTGTVPAPGLAPLPLLRTARRPAGGMGLRPRVFSAHRFGFGPQLQVHAPAWRLGCCAPPFGRAGRLQTSDRPRPPSHAHFHSLTDQILCRFRLALQRTPRPGGKPKAQGAHQKMGRFGYLPLMGETAGGLGADVLFLLR
jgi:hypothetical protein